MITTFHNKKISKEKVPCKCLEECKYVQEKIKTDEDLEKSDSNDETELNIDNDEYDE